MYDNCHDHYGSSDGRILASYMGGLGSNLGRPGSYKDLNIDSDRSFAGHEMQVMKRP